MSLNIAVLVPCYNEEIAILRVIKDFRSALPQAKIYIFDNNSTDNTAAIARANGAIVRNVPLQGKGNVVRRMFADIEADVYVLVDGDDTYHAASAPLMIEALVMDDLDMVVGKRESIGDGAYRSGHVWGNRLLTECVTKLFGHAFTDILSGYRVFSKRYVKSFPATARGFEIEAELTVHALELRMPIGEVVTPYKSRPEGSESKLSTYRDGVRILRTILNMYRLEKPLMFYGLMGIVIFAAAIILMVPIVVTYFETGLVPRVPTAILGTGMSVVAALSMWCGLILDTVTRGRQEMKRLFYLNNFQKSSWTPMDTIKKIQAVR